jgi:UDP:flavonoid glycosyltransferase YjiC (YdhE family)
MRVLLTAPSSKSRLHNLVPMAWALRTTGHDVKIAGRPGFVDAITRTGTVAVEIGDGDPNSLADDAAVADLVDFARLWRPDVVISAERAPAGAVAARAAGAVSVRVLGVADEQARSDADTTFDTVPRSLRDGGHRPIRYLPYSGPAVVPAWLRRKARRDRIWLALTGAQTFAPVFEAVGGLDVEVVCAATADRVGAGTRVPANVRLVDSAPPRAVLPTCTAVVHDGDPDTALTALTRGLPQLDVSPGPMTRRIAEAGAGLIAEDLGALSERIQSLLTDESVRARAGELRAEIAAMPLPREVVPLLVELAASR